MFDLIDFELSLFKSRSVLSSVQWSTRNKRVNLQKLIKKRKALKLFSLIA